METNQRLKIANDIFKLLKIFQFCLQLALLVFTINFMKNSEVFILYLIADISLLVWNSLSILYNFYDKSIRKYTESVLLLLLILFYGPLLISSILRYIQISAGTAKIIGNYATPTDFTILIFLPAILIIIIQLIIAFILIDIGKITGQITTQ
ncbi:UNVERIFIED_CONTAM: hypothetical protein RMT77_007537 [Armadillidium vulgare]